MAEAESETVRFTVAVPAVVGVPLMVRVLPLVMEAERPSGRPVAVQVNPGVPPVPLTVTVSGALGGAEGGSDGDGGRPGKGDEAGWNRSGELGGSDVGGCESGCAELRR